jgi:hypothetical protein
MADRIAREEFDHHWAHRFEGKHGLGRVLSRRGRIVRDQRPEPVSPRYEIRVRGRLGETMRSAFPTMQAETRGKDTVLTGVLADQAALYGVLAQIEALGLELIELHPVP